VGSSWLVGVCEVGFVSRLGGVEVDVLGPGEEVGNGAMVTDLPGGPLVAGFVFPTSRSADLTAPKWDCDGDCICKECPGPVPCCPPNWVELVPLCTGKEACLTGPPIPAPPPAPARPSPKPNPASVESVVPLLWLALEFEAELFELAFEVKFEVVGESTVVVPLGG
jgi:hypothetical protein